ncbi:MAG TPA: glycosyltransferase, partial [Myxococcales bacterium]|nr:glycosyltransferase [Myxococcales bacterium]
VAGRIIRTGFLPPDETSAALLSCHVMVMPYLDGVSLRRGTLMACLNHGRPTITTHPATPLTQLQHGQNIYLVPPDSPQALATAVKCLRKDPYQRKMIGDGAKAVSDIFTWDKIAVQTLEFFQRVIVNR